MMIRKRSTGNNNTKKLVIKSLKNVPQLPENFYEETWQKLSKAVSAIHTSQPVSDSKESLYNAVKDLCTNKLAAETFTKLQEQHRVRLQELAQTATNSIQNSDSSSFLSVIDNLWNTQCREIRMIRDIFLFLDRTYVFQRSDIRSLWDMGLSLFLSEVLSDSKTKEKLLSGLLTVITQERNNETINRSLVQNLVRMLSSLSIYSGFFEPAFLNSTKEFYEKLAAEKIEQLNVPQYLKFVENCLREENERLVCYLESSTKKSLIPLVESQLILRFVPIILDRGVFSLMKESAQEDLARMYSLLSSVHALGDLKEYFNSYIKTTGMEIVIPPERDEVMVEELLNFKEKLDKLYKGAFCSDPDFGASMKEAFENFINKRPNKPAELLAKFTDRKLRSGDKSHTEEELEAVLDNMMAIFRFVSGKDVFQAFYRQYLSKRLLLGKSASIELEKSMISKLKQECGSGFTSKLESMFSDMNISKELMQNFKNKTVSLNLDTELLVNVLTMGVWPKSAPVDVILPPQMTKLLEIFNEFYLQKYQGRKLTWQHALGHCVMSGMFPKGNKILCLSLFQTVIMLLFNDANKLTYNEIKEATGINEKDLKASLLPLACGKARILVKQPQGKDITPDAVFYYNKTFTHKLIRLTINQIQMKETEEERQTTNSDVIVERQYQIDAGIVRIMKTRKTLSHTLLLSELYNQLKFPADPPTIKKRIASLIEREYLERDEENNQLYHYLA